MKNLPGILTTQARLSHLGDLVKLALQAQKLHSHLSPSDFKSDIDQDDLRDLFCTLLGQEDSHVAVAETGEKTAGFIWFEVQNRPETALTRQKKALFLQQICVDEGHRRQGIGAALMRCLDDFALKIGAEEIALGTWAGNPAAQNFFPALGYETVTFLMRKATEPHR